MDGKTRSAGTGVGKAMVAAMPDLQKFGFKPAAWMGAAGFEKMAELGAEWLVFVTDRIKEDVRTHHKMLHCKNVAELQAIQTEFLERAVEQYRAETGKMIKLSTEMLTGSIGEAEKAEDVHRHSTPV